MYAMKEVRVISDDQNSNECLKQLNQVSLSFSPPTTKNLYLHFFSYGIASEISKMRSNMLNRSVLGVDNLSVYLEFVSGGSIHKLLSEYGPFSEPLIQNYTKQILSGLAYLHGRKTMHRDIKGANILVGPNREIKPYDNLFLMLSFEGSAYWMAPEVIDNTSGYSLAVDIWSLGCTILEMATSKPPWSHYEGVAAILKIAQSKSYPEIPSHLSEDAQSYVKLCLLRDPSIRPPASQLLHHTFIEN
ncbi:hypothetical protein NC651_005546 [Populus alba x Populus x berolinensis]|nr:hypothetical protein NC651_005546 [Populus alba x Populus x berolinensis]